MPDSLHTSIMRAVESSRRQAVRRPAVAFGWASASAAAAVSVLALLWFLYRAPSGSTREKPIAQSFTQVTGVFDAGQQLASTMPNNLVAPLSDEWQRLNHDLDQTGQYLLASLP